jgi:hypothetical protein
MMAVTMADNHGAVVIYKVGTVADVYGIAAQYEGASGTNNLALQNQLLGMQSGFSSRTTQLGQDLDSGQNSQAKSGATLWHFECNYLVNHIATWKTTDCWRGEIGC